MTGPVRVRTATPADRAAIGRLWQELMDFHTHLDPEVFDLRDDALAIWLDWLDEWLADLDRVVLVADAGSEVVGYIMGKPEEGPPVYKRRQYGAVHDTCVTQTWRRRGVGQALVVALLEWFRARGLVEAQVGAAARNPVSNPFWRAMGFNPHMVQMRRPVNARTET